MGDIYRDADAVLIVHACALRLTQVKFDKAMSGMEGAIELWRVGTPYYAEECQFWTEGEGYARLVMPCSLGQIGAPIGHSEEEE
jgi:hypothetical protein